MSSVGNGKARKFRRLPSNSVFLNCSFTAEYRGIFDAALFAIYDCGFCPRCALEISYGGQNRLQKIYNIVSECHYGIHDISYMELDPSTNLPWFNMPFELGIFLGCKEFGQGQGKKSARSSSIASLTDTSLLCQISPAKILKRTKAIRV